MKRVWSVALVLALALCLCGCGAEQSSESAEEASAAQAELEQAKAEAEQAKAEAEAAKAEAEAAKAEAEKAAAEKEKAEAEAAAKAEAAKPAVEIIRYADENGRIKETPPASLVAENLSSFGYQGYASVDVVETGIPFSPRNGVYVTQLWAAVYEKPWSYVQSITLYYTYEATDNGGTNFQLDPDTIETSYDEIYCDYTKDDILWMNDVDKEYFGASPTSGVPWKDPVTEEWTIDGEPYEGGLYGW